MSLFVMYERIQVSGFLPLVFCSLFLWLLLLPCRARPDGDSQGTEEVRLHFSLAKAQWHQKNHTATLRSCTGVSPVQGERLCKSQPYLVINPGFWSKMTCISLYWEYAYNPYCYWKRPSSCSVNLESSVPLDKKNQFKVVNSNCNTLSLKNHCFNKLKQYLLIDEHRTEFSYASGNNPFWSHMPRL